jgi:hypothetical protein
VNKTAVRFTVASQEARAVVKLNGGLGLSKGVKIYQQEIDGDGVEP